jgi:hypothetical protein
MIANIALDDGLILPHSANPTGSNFREQQRSVIVLTDFAITDVTTAHVTERNEPPAWGVQSVPRILT